MTMFIVKSKLCLRVSFWLGTNPFPQMKHTKKMITNYTGKYNLNNTEFKNRLSEAQRTSNPSRTLFNPQSTHDTNVRVRDKQPK